ncbi:MAG: YqgE/AlgH family protein [Pseudomonadota bacterium]
MAKNQTALKLKGHLLIAMPGMADERFAKTVIFIVSHDETGSMGFVLNQPVVEPTFSDILDELKMKAALENLRRLKREIPVFRGGPVEQGRGFVIHSLEASTKSSARVDDLCAVTATLDILKTMSGERPPAQSRMMLGYSGWSAGQLENEIAQNGWLTTKATREIIFAESPKAQYDMALGLLGISQATLSASAGRA